MAKYSSGLYKTKNPQKYLGNTNNITFRSGWERRIMLFLDSSDLIVSWSSEEKNCIIPYKLDGKWKRYFCDFYVKTINGHEYLWEIKPEKKLTIPSKKSKNYLLESLEYVQIQLKADAAKKYADSKGFKYLFITEKIVRSEYSDKKLLENLMKVVIF